MSESKVKVGPSDKTIGGHIVLKVSDMESPFYNMEYYYDGMKFADQENEDGSMEMKFDYVIVEGVPPQGMLREFEQFIGDQLLAIMEEQIARQEVVFKGGTGETIVLTD
jgi:hypothetical protein